MAKLQAQMDAFEQRMAQSESRSDRMSESQRAIERVLTGLAVRINTSLPEIDVLRAEQEALEAEEQAVNLVAGIAGVNGISAFFLNYTLWNEYALLFHASKAMFFRVLWSGRSMTRRRESVLSLRLCMRRAAVGEAGQRGVFAAQQDVVHAFRIRREHIARRLAGLVVQLTD